MHGSDGIVTKKTVPKKRQVTCFSCDACQSTFDSKIKGKTHIEKQHGKKRKIQPLPLPGKHKKQEDLDTRIEDNDAEDFDNMFDMDEQTESEPSPINQEEEINKLRYRIENVNRKLFALEEKVAH